MTRLQVALEAYQVVGDSLAVHHADSITPQTGFLAGSYVCLHCSSPNLEAMATKQWDEIVRGSVKPRPSTDKTRNIEEKFDGSLANININFLQRHSGSQSEVIKHFQCTHAGKSRLPEYFMSGAA